MTTVNSQQLAVTSKRGTKPLFKSIVICLPLAFLLFTVFSAEAQQPKKIPRIGYLTVAGPSPSRALLQGLRDLGYVEGQNIAIDYRSADGKRDRLSDLAGELVRLKVDIIVADGSAPSLEAKKATSTIPIVMTSSTDPIGNGLVASLARPGGNVTGLTSVTGELGGKLLELLKEIVPRLNRVAIVSSGGPANVLFVKETEPAARALGVKLIHQVVRRPEDFESAFEAITKQRVNGLLSRLGPSFVPAQHKRLVEFAAKRRLPAISADRDWVDSGGLIFYGADQNARQRRVATYIDKILKGTKPAELPVEAPTKFELVINLKTAKQIGLTIPPNVLARADRVVR
jgi:putative ABC transport system substrate-binding protein